MADSSETAMIHTTSLMSFLHHLRNPRFRAEVTDSYWENETLCTTIILFEFKPEPGATLWEPPESTINMKWGHPTMDDSIRQTVSAFFNLALHRVASQLEEFRNQKQISNMTLKSTVISRMSFSPDQLANAHRDEVGVRSGSVQRALTIYSTWLTQDLSGQWQEYQRQIRVRAYLESHGAGPQ
ncbi:hypothetical protein TREMEDRAFT_65945 [Tremella mesenterica DSM 1558]|uniref:uncharacterized protein n=1 Tax=Tremella mesenterica (strain ATCC 24925 / CBS 8224 / DSM 1558 / NBRC 9311 / NRRL Y-6157 / RJB 2259-6 / UBC 559-6) TaxID=578456 RepID=UPI00032CA4E3|nr:uncharacterized protein TREMEDRAFT_65945 [Tremella mesenterica DSM 1558]EIW66097.1 hypothetical protein TREMEDRAFT_65945 [Tremella mesenterica DSM 1558]